MDINLKNTLRNLRRQKNVTQDELARYLGISQQSVGKWERGEGYPDITLLPKIAIFFNVTIDDLLDVGPARIEEKISSYTSKSEVLRQNGKLRDNVELWEEAHREFPDNIFIMSNLQKALFLLGPHRDDTIITNKIESLCNRILSESNDIEMREAAICSLCCIYRNQENFDKALQFANMSSSIAFSREILRADVLQWGEEGARESQKCLAELIFQAAITSYQLAMKYDLMASNVHCKAEPHHLEQKKQALIFAIDLINLLFTDGNYGNFASEISLMYIALAEVCLGEGDTDTTISYLEKAADICIAHVTGSGGEYTAPMVNLLNFKPNPTRTYRDNACNRALDFIRHVNLARIFSHPKYKEVEIKLLEYSE